MTEKQKAVVNYLVGQVMRVNRKANPTVVRELVIEALERKTK